MIDAVDDYHCVPSDEAPHSASTEKWWIPISFMRFRIDLLERNRNYRDTLIIGWIKNKINLVALYRSSPSGASDGIVHGPCTIPLRQ